MRTTLAMAALAAALALLPSPAASEGEFLGSEGCAVCHEEVVRDFQKTAHAAAPGWDAEAGCEQCHGPGEPHIEAGDGTAIRQPTKLPPRQAAEVCLACHKEDHGRFAFRRSLHSLNDVTCVDCHNPHSTADRLRRSGGIELCAKCHQGVVGQFSLPRSHPLSDADIGCANCHNPHGTKNRRSLGRFGNDTCVSCHAEKAGPFLYNHDVSMVDGCRSCHQIHGSPNRHLLTHSRMINLCYQCHPANTTPSFHNAATFLNEKCTACHTAIHGSNTHPYYLEE